MKATIEIENDLYRRAKIAAATRGRKIKELVAEGLQRVLNDSAVPMTGRHQAHFSAYWGRYFGAFKGEKWEKPKRELMEKREDW
jgi:CRISPR/Cas system CSM-associated protein Csm2 small subunit